MKKNQGKTVLEWAQDIPSFVWAVKAAQYMGTPIGASTYEKAITEYPEYFPEEAEHERKWKAIPQSVHDAYLAEAMKLHDEAFADHDKQYASKGIFYYATHPEEQAEYENAMKEWNRCYEKEKELTKGLHDKYYKKYLS